MIARLQMSDLHLGDPRSVFASPEVVRKVTAELASVSNGHIGKLILAGDVWEESVPGNLDRLANGIARSVVDASTSFFTSLYGQVKIDEIVVVPGNHDLCTWHWYQSSRKEPTVTGSDGVAVDPLAWPWFSLLGDWGGKLTFAYPLYRDASVGDDYPVLYVTHGHLLDPLVLGEDSEMEYTALEAIGVRKPNVQPLDGADTVREIAEGTLDFCVALWQRYSARDYVYANYVMRRLLHPESCHLQSSSLTWINASECLIDDPSPELGNFANAQRFLELCVRDPNLPTPVGTFGMGPAGPTFSMPSCLTFGHDHRGTFRRLSACGVPFVAADSGGWTIEWDGQMPHSHVLVWSKITDVVPSPYLVNLRKTL